MRSKYSNTITVLTRPFMSGAWECPTKVSESSVVDSLLDSAGIFLPTSARLPKSNFNDEYDEDEDDDLALAALESLDAIEVFKHDHRVDTVIVFEYFDRIKGLQCCKGKVIILVFIVLIVGRFIYGEDRIKLLFGSLADVGRKIPAESNKESTTEDSETCSSTEKPGAWECPTKVSESSVVDSLLDSAGIFLPCAGLLRR
jgi:hypothetical protein